MRTKNTEYIIIYLLAVAFFSASICFAEEEVVSNLAANAELSTMVLEAPTISLEGELYSADGPVKFYIENKVISASSLQYNSGNKGVWAKNASFTTCNHNPPHYLLKTSKLSLSENNWLDARDISIKLGKVGIFYFPWMKLHLSKKRGQSTFFPMIWYDDSGFSVSKNFILKDSDRVISTAKVKMSQKDNFETQTSLQFGVDGNLHQIPGRELAAEYWGQDSLFLLRDTRRQFNSELDTTRAEAARLKFYADYALNQRVEDINSGKIKVFKKPEVGLRYTGKPLGWNISKLDKSLPLSPTVDISFGKMKEEPSDFNVLNRTKLSVSTAINLFDFGKTLAIQPVVQQTWYKYRRMPDYQIFTYGIDVAQIRRNNSDFNLRYLNRTDKGTPVFKVEDIDVKHELQLATNFKRHGHNYSLGLAYDANRKYFYEWEAGYGYETNCLDVGIYYNNRLKRVGFNLLLKDL